MRAELAELVNGDLQLIDIVASSTVSVVNGTIESETTLLAEGPLSYSVVKWTDCPQNTGHYLAKFSARVVDRDISLSGLTLSDPNIDDRSVSGTLGSGDGSIELEVTNGDIKTTGN